MFAEAMRKDSTAKYVASLEKNSSIEKINYYFYCRDCREVNKKTGTSFEYINILLVSYSGNTLHFCRNCQLEIELQLRLRLLSIKFVKI